MALQLRNLCCMSYAAGFTLWQYDARGDRMQDVYELDYFADCREMIKRGDAAYISCVDGLMHICFTDPTMRTFTAMSAARYPGS